MMEIENLIVLLLLTALAAYVQTLTGFALGLLLMGGVGLTNIMSLPDAAILVSVLTLVNAIQILARGWRNIAKREFLLVIFVSLIFILVGYWLLNLFVAASLNWLKLILGSIIVLSSFQLLLRPKTLTKTSNPLSFFFVSMISGLMGGLFSTAGPPLVYYFHRQPLSAVAIRETLVAIFAVNNMLRLFLVHLDGNMPELSMWLGTFWCIPVVVIFTALARAYPPPLTKTGIKNITFCLLFLSGISLALPIYIKFIADFL